MANYSAFCLVVDDLLARWGAAVTAAYPDVRIVDGPMIGDDGCTLLLQIGMEISSLDDPEAPLEANVSGSTQIEWAGLGNLARDETLVVNSVITSWIGTTGMKAARDAADGILRACQQVLYENAEVGSAWNGRLASTEWQVGQSDTGVFVVCKFSVDAFARLNT